MHSYPVHFVMRMKNCRKMTESVSEKLGNLSSIYSNRLMMLLPLSENIDS